VHERSRQLSYLSSHSRAKPDHGGASFRFSIFAQGIPVGFSSFIDSKAEEVEDLAGKI